ncbi:MAG: universal stress protein [Bacteroidales bacterium]|nr:universal stress protein [Bacteroidales bacterium]MCF8328058.1 universal stress protein [Bacteroidales bacterium]
MYKFDHILVALDLSDMDSFLIRYSNFLLEKFKPKSITFLHVIKSYEIPKDVRAKFPEMDEPLADIVKEELSAKIKELLIDAGKTDVHVVVKEGVTTETIVQYSQLNDITLTLMGKKIGYKGHGGVVRKVLNITPSSVLLISETAQPKMDHLLVRMDFTKMSVMAMKMALKIQEQTEAKISCHHVHKLPLKYFTRSSVSDENKLEREIYNYTQKEFKKFVKKNKLAANDIPCTSALDFENEEAQILYSKALTISADLIVLGTKIKSSMADVILESTSEKLAGPEKNIPVFVVKDRSQTMGFLNALFD